jgi:hypothetical protein
MGISPLLEGYFPEGSFVWLTFFYSVVADIWFFILLLIYSFALANECSLVLARALGLPTASFWGFGYQGGEVKIIREIIF